MCDEEHIEKPYEESPFVVQSQYSTRAIFPFFFATQTPTLKKL